MPGIGDMLQTPSSSPPGVCSPGGQVEKQKIKPRAESRALWDISEVYLTWWMRLVGGEPSLQGTEHVQTGDTGSVVCAEAPLGTAEAPAQKS